MIPCKPENPFHTQRALRRACSRAFIRNRLHVSEVPLCIVEEMCDEKGRGGYIVTQVRCWLVRVWKRVLHRIYPGKSQSVHTRARVHFYRIQGVHVASRRQHTRTVSKQVT